MGSIHVFVQQHSEVNLNHNSCVRVVFGREGYNIICKMGKFTTSATSPFFPIKEKIKFMIALPQITFKEEPLKTICMIDHDFFL